MAVLVLKQQITMVSLRSGKRFLIYIDKQELVTFFVRIKEDLG